MKTFHLFTLKAWLLLHIYFQEKPFVLFFFAGVLKKIHHGAKFCHLKVKHWGGSVGGFFF